MSEYRVAVKPYPSESGEVPGYLVNIYRVGERGVETEIINGLRVRVDENLEHKVNLQINTYEAKYGYSFKVTTHGD